VSEYIEDFLSAFVKYALQNFLSALPDKNTMRIYVVMQFTIYDKGTVVW